MSFSSAFDAAPNEPNRKSGLGSFDAVEAAAAFKPLPAGIYTARIVSGSLCQTKKGDDAYRMTFEVSEGELRARRVSRTWTFSEKAIGYAKRDLAAFGLTTSQKLLEVFPPIGREVYVKLTVAMQRGDDGKSEFNDVKRIDILRIDETPAAPFLIDPDKSEGGITI